MGSGRTGRTAFVNNWFGHTSKSRKESSVKGVEEEEGVRRVLSEQ